MTYEVYNIYLDNKKIEGKVIGEKIIEAYSDCAKYDYIKLRENIKDRVVIYDLGLSKEEVFINMNLKTLEVSQIGFVGRIQKMKDIFEKRTELKLKDLILKLGK